MVKFDCIIGNPPYNRHMIKNPPSGNHAGYPHIMFIEQLLSRCDTMQLIIPASFMTLKVLKPFRQWVLENYYVKDITLKNNADNKQFNIDMDHIAILQIQNTPTATTYNNDFEVILNSNCWPLYNTKEDVELFRNTLANNKPVTISKNIPREGTNYISFGIRDYETKNGWRLNSSKETIKHLAYILFNDKEEAERNWDYFSTDEYARCLTMMQSINKVQPYWVEYIGKI